MYSAYCSHGALILYFFSAAGSTLWQGSSSDTRKDLKISTDGAEDEGGAAVVVPELGWTEAVVSSEVAVVRRRLLVVMVLLLVEESRV